MNLLSIAGFTNLGFRLHARDFDPVVADMTGKTVLITGATGGLGLATAESVATLGARTLVVGRSAEKLASVCAGLGGDVVGYQADLSLMGEIRDLAHRIAQEEDRLDILINNVGVLNPERRITSEGIEATLATDLAGHFLLTNLLILRLVASAPSRVINVTSGGMYGERIRPRDMEFEKGEYKGAAAYARAKRGQMVLTEMWADRLEGTGVTVHAMHPGWAATAGVEGSLPTFNRVMRPFLRTPEQGADTMVWLAAAEAPAQASGRLWFDRRQVGTHLVERTRASGEDRQAMWDALVELTGSDFPELVA